ncbi:SET domain [Trypanosoma melophagium]|uniref:SET domain n=1 Tax=Trypanosoma melophagium TaxID=715481 RepID=UPI00351AA25A|nr:SET domain [Trypanosoma melophagium]
MLRLRFCCNAGLPHRCLTAVLTSSTVINTSIITSSRYSHMKQETEKNTTNTMNTNCSTSTNSEKSATDDPITATSSSNNNDNIDIDGESGVYDDMPLRRARVEERGATAYPRVRVIPQEWDPQQQEKENEKDIKLSHDNNNDSDNVSKHFHKDIKDDHVMDSSNKEASDFLTTRAEAVGKSRLLRNSQLTSPTHPDDVAPEFRRIRKHQRMAVVFVAADDDYSNYYPNSDPALLKGENGVFINNSSISSGRRDQFVAFPPPALHPWVRNTPIGPFILHGDGHIKVAGTGEVGFNCPRITEERKGETEKEKEEEREMAVLPHHFRGLQHRSVLQQRLPQKNGKVIQDAVVKNSFTLTGRGVFATREIAAGEIIMIVRQTARNLGVKSEVERLEEMCVDVLLAVYEGTSEDLSYLHDWILTGQPSSLLEYWPITATQHVLERIGGMKVLHALELHEIHIARLAAIIDMNSFLVESYYAERKGMAYFPEAGFLNHSCMPNATYDIIPEHTFKETDYYMDALEEEEAEEEEAEKNEKETPLSDTTVSNKNAKKDDVTHFGNTNPSNNSNNTSLSNNNDDSDSISNTNTNKNKNNHSTSGEKALTLDPSVEYLFCCRATVNIPAGAEILISYVPPTWSFDNRQYVLHDRYRFWCKCPKCAPILDSKYSRLPKLVVGLLFFSVFLQLLVMHQRDVEQMAARERSNKEDNEDIHSSSSSLLSQEQQQQQQEKRSRGLFELAEEERLREMYTLDRGPMPAPFVNEPYARPPR